MPASMSTLRRFIPVTSLLAGGVAAGMLAAGSLGATRGAFASPSTTAATKAGAAGFPSFADLAQQVVPAVVSIRSTDIVRSDTSGPQIHRFGGEGSPFEFFFGPNGPMFPHGDGGGGSEERKEVASGTGFIVEPDGYILTNNHVVENARKVEVLFGKNDDVYEAKVVGRDAPTDLALLKIEGKHPFPTVALGDSARLRVGEWVMAIGDPLDFENTVTVGVISGKGRRAGLSRATQSFEDLLQTDAAINFGNSGGPLVNTHGEVIGINTAISSVGQNIGFAVPINVAKRLLPQLKTGKVVRGFLGVQVAPIDHALEEALALKSEEGALVESVEKGSPGEKAGLKHGDVLVRADDVPVKTTRDLIDYISSTAPGTKVTVRFLRDGKERSAVATLETRAVKGEMTGPTPEEQGEAREKLGMTIQDLDPALRSAYQIDGNVKGVVITHIKPVSPAADASLAEGDVVLEVNGGAISSVSDFRTAVKKVGDARWLRLYVLRSTPQSQEFIAAVRLKDSSRPS